NYAIRRSGLVQPFVSWLAEPSRRSPVVQVHSQARLYLSGTGGTVACVSNCIQTCSRNGFLTALAPPERAAVKPLKGGEPFIVDVSFIFQKCNAKFLIVSFAANVTEVERSVRDAAGGFAAGWGANLFR